MAKLDIEHAQSVLLKMEKQARCRIGSAAVSEPECEVHADDQSAGLQEHLDDIISLRDLFMKQSEALAMTTPNGDEKMELHSDPFSLHTGEISSTDGSTISDLASKSFEETLEHVTHQMENSLAETFLEISPTVMTELGPYQEYYDGGFRKTYNFDESEEMDASEFDFEGSDSEIQAAINEIRKEASQMDIIMALDQLKTVQNDLDVMTRTFRERSIESDDLRHQLHEKEERLACLELERDLYKADASKLRDDLKTCVDRMFDISAVAGSSSLDPDVIEEASNEEPSHDQYILRRMTPEHSDFCFPVLSPSRALASEASSSKTSSANDSKRIPPQHARRPIIRRSPSSSDPVKPSRDAAVTIVTETFPLLGSAHSNGIFRLNPANPSPGSAASVSSPSTITAERHSLRPTERRHKSFSAAISSPQYTICEDMDGGKENRMCGLFRRRHSKRSASKARDIAIMREQIDELHFMMRTSLETSAKLRKRLAMISRYYEGIIRKIQEQMSGTKAEKARMKTDLDYKISAIDHEKRISIIQLESKLRQRDEEVARLKREMKRSYEI